MTECISAVSIKVRWAWWWPIYLGTLIWLVDWFGVAVNTDRLDYWMERAMSFSFELEE